MCAELLKGHAKAIYSYGVNGFDGWAAEASKRLGGAVVEQYDCFNTQRPACPEGMTCNFKFHEECIGDKSHTTWEGRTFSTLREQLTKNGHLAAENSTDVDLVMKMDIEGGEWAVLAADDAKDLLKHFSQVVVEFHGADYPWGLKGKAVENLLDLFEVVHIHANNCCEALKTADGYVIPSFLEVTFVRKGLVQKRACDPSPAPLPIDHRNVPDRPALPRIQLGP